MVLHTCNQEAESRGSKVQASLHAQWNCQINKWSSSYVPLRNKLPQTSFLSKNCDPIDMRQSTAMALHYLTMSEDTPEETEVARN